MIIIFVNLNTITRPRLYLAFGVLHVLLCTFDIIKVQHLLPKALYL